MSGKPNKRQKLLYLLKIFYEYTDEFHPLNAPQLIELLNGYGIECERKSIYRDIECLNEFGVEIMQSTFPQGYYLGERIFEIPEQRMLIDSVRASEFITEKKTKELISKLKQLVSVYQAAELDDDYIHNRPKNRNERIYYSIDTLHTAIRCGKKVHFSYYRHTISHGKPVARKSHEFTVSPYALIWNDGKYYLVANYDKYDDLSHYRVDRMKQVDIMIDDVRPLCEVSDFADKFDEAEYVSRVFGMYAGRNPEKIELKCSGKSLEHIVERFGRDINYKVLQENPDGSCESFYVCVSAVINEGFVSWILAQRGEVQVLSPYDLVIRMKEMLKNMLMQYGV